MNLHLLNFLTLASLASANHKNMRGLMKKKKPNPKCKASIAVANRASGTLSILDTGSANNVKTIKMPGSNAEPMYVVAVNGYVYVGDRKNNWVAVFKASKNLKFDVVKLMPAGKGVFHMWADASGERLWLNNDIDNTITVYNLRSHVPIKTIDIPSDLVDLGGKPHDVVLSPDGKYAFVTIVGLTSGVLLKYNAETYEVEQRRDDLSSDPHVGLTFSNNKLYVPQQGGDVVNILSQDNIMDTVADISIPDAHGVGTSKYHSAMYFTDIAGDESGLYAVDLKNDTLVGSKSSSTGTPHNIAASKDKLFVTHSGADSEIVSVYSASVDKPVPVFDKNVWVGLNPFGLAHVEPMGCVPDEDL